MSAVLAVAYAKHGRLHYAAWPGDADRPAPAIGDQVMVDHPTGRRVATVLWGPAEPAEPITVQLPAVLGPATEQDLAQDADSRHRAARARTVARRQVRERNLPMQIVGTEWSPAEARVTIWFAAPHRVDFRELVRALSAELAMRVLLHQVNERERAKLVGGVGVCGRELCCSTFLDRFEPVTIQMARDQHLASDPLRIAGACGRLMCCLRYEHPSYVDFTGAPPGGGDCSAAGSCGPRQSHDEHHPRDEHRPRDEQHPDRRRRGRR